MIYKVETKGYGAWLVEASSSAEVEAIVRRDVPPLFSPPEPVEIDGPVDADGKPTKLMSTPKAKTVDWDDALRAVRIELVSERKLLR